MPLKKRSPSIDGVVQPLWLMPVIDREFRELLSSIDDMIPVAFEMVIWNSSL